MINFRYHIVSIVAVFLALGIGTALGGTFLNRYTADLLDESVRRAESRIRDTEAQNRRLVKLVDQSDQRGESLLGARLLGGLLTDVPVLLVTAPGVDPQVISGLRIALDQADADLRGNLELQPSMLMEDEADDQVAAAVGRPATDLKAVRAAVFERLRVALRAAGAATEPPGEAPATSTSTSGPDGPVTSSTPGGATTPTFGPTPNGSTTSTTDSTSTVPGQVPADGTLPAVTAGTQPEIVTALLAADYARYVPGPGLTVEDPILATTGYRYVFVSGPDLDAEANSLLLRLLSADQSANPLPAVVVSASVPDDSQDRVPTVVAQVRESNDLVSRYSTVDDVEQFTGLLATVLVLDQPELAMPGHYGQAPGATAIRPPPS